MKYYKTVLLNFIFYYLRKTNNITIILFQTKYIFLHQSFIPSHRRLHLLTLTTMEGVSTFCPPYQEDFCIGIESISKV